MHQLREREWTRLKRIYETKKSIHINLTLGTHSEFRKQLFSKGLSMQEVLEECAVRIASEDSYMTRLCDDLVERKINGNRKIAASDSDSVFRIIEKDNPFDRDGE